MELKLISQPKALHLIAQISQQGAPVEIFLGEDFGAKKNNKSKPLESKAQLESKASALDEK